MTTPEEALKLIPARSLDTLLGVLKALRQRANAGEALTMPCLLIRLRSGSTLTGWLLDVAHDRGETVVLIHEGDCHSRTPDIDATYVNSRDIEAVTIRAAGSHAHHLSFGAVVFQPGTEPPSMLALRRRADEIGGETGVLLSLETKPEDDNKRFRLEQYLEALGTVLRRFSADDIGREALKGLRVSLQEGRTSANREGDVVVLHVDLQTAPEIEVLSAALSELL